MNQTVGDTVFYESGGRALARLKPGANPSNTVEQQLHRRRFAEALEWCKVFREVIKVGFRKRARHLTAWNVFLEYCIAGITVKWLDAPEHPELAEDVVLQKEDMKVTEDFSKFRVADGPYPEPAGVKAQAMEEEENRSLQFTHEAEETGAMPHLRST